MLEMKKNTRAKIVSLAASAFALATVFGLVHRGAAQTAGAQPLVAAPAVAQQGAAVTTSAQARSSLPVAQSPSSVTVHTTTHVS